jgi:glycosyltransferase involved in cell wall biosynthesis
MRILHLTEPGDGGVAENVRLLAHGMSDRGHDVEVAGPADSKIYPGLAARGVCIHVIDDLVPGFGNPRADLRAFVRIWRLLRGGRYDLVHCHSAKAGVLGRIAGPALGVPVAFSPHSFSFVGDFSERRRRFAVWLEQRLAKRTGVLVCACEEERRQAISHDVDCARALVYYGVPDADLELEPDADLAAFGAGGPLIASLAALRPQKTLEVLLEAAPEILRRVPKARLAVVGNGPERDALQQRAHELGLDGDPRFTFMDFTGPSGRYLRQLTLFVLPSSWEALPIGVLEALSYGVPQVVTDVGGTAEAVDDETGRVVPPRDPRAFGAAVIDVLSDESRLAEMAMRSRVRHEERFSAERMVADTLDAYATAISLGTAVGQPGDGAA